MDEVQRTFSISDIESSPAGDERLSVWQLCEKQIQNLFLTAQSTQIKSVTSVQIKDFIHHYLGALFNDIPRVVA